MIGGGTAGLGAYRAAKAHTSSVVMIEGGPYGTTCARVGCMPSKLLIAAAESVHQIEKAPQFGVHPQGDITINGREVMDRVKRERDRFVGFVLEGVDEIPAQDKIVGYAQLLQRDLGENDKYTNKINFIFDGVQRIERVISSLINYANEPAITSERKYPLVQYIEQKKMIWSQEFSREINLEFKSEISKKIETTLNKRGLDSILQNLILNSCEASKDEIVNISMDIKNLKNQLIITLNDFGEGMSSENLNKCKEPFFTTRINGLGLGLSIVENLVLIMNGSINIKSSLGEGTQIELIFPQEKTS